MPGLSGYTILGIYVAVVITNLLITTWNYHLVPRNLLYIVASHCCLANWSATIEELRQICFIDSCLELEANDTFGKLVTLLEANLLKWVWLVLFGALTLSLWLKKEFARFSTNESEYAVCCMYERIPYANTEIVIIVITRIFKVW